MLMKCIKMAMEFIHLYEKSRSRNLTFIIIEIKDVDGVN